MKHIILLLIFFTVSLALMADPPPAGSTIQIKDPAPSKTGVVSPGKTTVSPTGTSPVVPGVISPGQPSVKPTGTSPVAPGVISSPPPTTTGMAPGVITTTTEIFDKISVAVWNVPALKKDWWNEWQRSAIILEQVFIKLKNGKLIPGAYESTKSLNPAYAYDGTGGEYTYKLPYTINKNDIEAIGFSGTGQVGGYQVIGRYGGVTCPLYYRPASSNFGSVTYVLTTDPAKITWLPNSGRVSTFVKRDAVLTLSLTDALPSTMLSLFVEIELTDGDFLLFRLKGPLTPGVKSARVPAPYSLKADQVVGARVYYGNAFLEFRNREAEAPIRPIIKYEFATERARISGFRVDYEEEEKEAVKKNMIFQQSTPIAAGSPYNDIPAVWESFIIRKRKLNADWRTSELLVQFITGNDDLRTNTKFIQHASQIGGDILTDPQQAPNLPAGAILQSNIPLLPNLPQNKLPYDWIGNWLLNHPESLQEFNIGNNGQTAYEGFNRSQVPFLVQFQVVTGKPSEWIAFQSPFGWGQTASIIIPTPDLRVTSMGELRPRPKLGRGASTIEHFEGAFGVDNDNWQMAGVIVSAWTDLGWKRIYSKFFGIPFYFKFGQDHSKMNVLLREQYESYKIQSTGNPVLPAPGTISKQ